MPQWRHSGVNTPIMATTARLPADLKAEADAYAAGLGISLNALLAVALRDYLDARKRAPAPPPELAPPALAGAPRGGLTAPRMGEGAKLPGRRAPCPCGSGKQYRHCCEDARPVHR